MISHSQVPVTGRSKESWESELILCDQNLRSALQRGEKERALYWHDRKAEAVAALEQIWLAEEMIKAWEARL